MGVLASDAPAPARHEAAGDLDSTAIKLFTPGLHNKIPA